MSAGRIGIREVDTAGPQESVLDVLCRQAEVPEYQCRVHWQPGTIAFWDNLAAQHYGVSDYYPQRRVMARAAIAGTARPGASHGNGQPV